MKKENIRNFCIIAHIDHGKSTLADRLLQICNNNVELKHKQILDDMELERERGITIKLNAVRLSYLDKRSNEEYIFHLIDTPGHVDFTYEVSRSLAACDGALLIIDSTQGVQAQTISNVYLAIENNLEIIPILNKADLPASRPEEVKSEIEDIIGISCENAPIISAKTGHNIDKVINQIIDLIPPPKSNENTQLKGLIFDSFYDNHKGVIISVCIKEGILRKNDEIYLMNSKFKFKVTNIMYKDPNIHEVEFLGSGCVGLISGNIKDISNVRVGDTITQFNDKAKEPLTGYKQLKSNVFSGIFPVDRSDYENLRDALEKLSLSDSSLQYEPESSEALGFGFRCGFLGLLHAEIIRERLEREFKLSLISTIPNVIYRVTKKDKSVMLVDSPSKMPHVQFIEKIEEPFTVTKIICPDEYIGSLMQLCQDSRGIYKSLDIVDKNRKMIIYEIPLSEIIFNFFDKLKSLSKGYASFDYDIVGYVENKLVKMDILLNGDRVDALSLVIHKDKAYQQGRLFCKKLKDIIPRKQFEIAIQACLNKKVISRETISAYRKNVTAKCYGGDISRKKKLLQKQKEGKKKMKQIGSIEIPKEAFISILDTKK